jgi:hypothetical protein
MSGVIRSLVRVTISSAGDAVQIYFSPVAKLRAVGISGFVNKLFALMLRWGGVWTRMRERFILWGGDLAEGRSWVYAIRHTSSRYKTQKSLRVLGRIVGMRRQLPRHLQLLKEFDPLSVFLTLGQRFWLEDRLLWRTLDLQDHLRWVPVWSQRAAFTLHECLILDRALVQSRKLIMELARLLRFEPSPDMENLMLQAEQLKAHLEGESVRVRMLWVVESLAELKDDRDPMIERLFGGIQSDSLIQAIQMEEGRVREPLASRIHEFDTELKRALALHLGPSVADDYKR